MAGLSTEVRTFVSERLMERNPLSRALFDREGV
jgi:hypothetical protein